MGPGQHLRRAAYPGEPERALPKLTRSLYTPAVKNGGGVAGGVRDHEPCIGTKDTSCVEMCPVNAITPEDQVPPE
jgi:NAD-dependent dihydropyrimidine dehydrogenase PreA subunit